MRDVGARAGDERRRVICRRYVAPVGTARFPGATKEFVAYALGLNFGAVALASGKAVMKLLGDDFMDTLGVWWFPAWLLNVATFGVSCFLGAAVGCLVDIGGVVSRGTADVVGAYAAVVSLVVVRSFFGVLIDALDVTFLCYVRDEEANAIGKPALTEMFDEIPYARRAPERAEAERNAPKKPPPAMQPPPTLVIQFGIRGETQTTASDADVPSPLYDETLLFTYSLARPSQSVASPRVLAPSHTFRVNARRTAPPARGRCDARARARILAQLDRALRTTETMARTVPHECRARRRRAPPRAPSRGRRRAIRV